ncbi:hypothetical protein DASC09_051220 [Saccharomycopsis crataegensis]|uniref:L domain-like protein n=1 Tax=Saccharomycopsis crataegensis TaxID=43959 RepID=A0AAV5QSE0_9ASCO|nr:hypothetical protein DASC09_051220 [Saccharomycopsis crataegensis]
MKLYLPQLPAEILLKIFRNFDHLFFNFQLTYINDFHPNIQQVFNAILFETVRIYISLRNKKGKLMHGIPGGYDVEKGPVFAVITSYIEKSFTLQNIQFIKTLEIKLPESESHCKSCVIDDLVLKKTEKRIEFMLTNLTQEIDLKIIEPRITLKLKDTNQRIKSMYLSSLKNLTTLSKNSHYFTNITNLTLQDVRLDNIGNLPCARSLRVLRFNHRGTNDLDGQNLRLPKLKSLDIFIEKEISIKNFNDVYLPLLENLTVHSGNAVSFESSLELPNLKKIHVDKNGSGTDSLVSYYGLEGLREGNFSSNCIKAIAPEISRWKNIEVLDLGFNNILSMKNVALVSTLRMLSLQGNKIRDIQGLSNCKNLQQLNLRRNKIVRLDGLHGVYNLERLDLSYNVIKGIHQNFTGFKRLEMLSISGNDIANIESLRKLTSLTTLDISHNNRIDDISPVIRLPKLTKFYMKGVKVKKISIGKLDLFLENEST